MWCCRSPTLPQCGHTVWCCRSPTQLQCGIAHHMIFDGYQTACFRSESNENGASQKPTWHDESLNGDVTVCFHSNSWYNNFCSQKTAQKWIMALTVSVPCSMWKWLDLEIHENVCLLATGYFPLQYHPAWLAISSVKK